MAYSGLTGVRLRWLGLNVIQAARLLGEAKIIGVDIVSNKLDWAREFRATYVINAGRENPVTRIHDIAGHGAPISPPR